MLWILSFTMLTNAAKQRHAPEDKNEFSATNPEARKRGWSPLSLPVIDSVNSRAVERRQRIKEACQCPPAMLRS